MGVERRPDPEPLEVNDLLVVGVGMAIWAVAFVVLLVADASGAGVHRWWIEMCGAGVVLGAFGLWYCSRRKH